MKILGVAILCSLLLAAGFFGRDRVEQSQRLGNTYRASVAHEFEVAAAVRKVMEQPATCGLNLAGLEFDPVAVAGGETAPVPAIMLTGGTIARVGLEQRGLRTTRLELTGAGMADLGVGPLGLRRYLVTLRVENQRASADASQSPLVAEMPVRICVDPTSGIIQSCDPCDGPGPGPSPSPTSSPTCADLGVSAGYASALCVSPMWHCNKGGTVFRDEIYPGPPACTYAAQVCCANCSGPNEPCGVGQRCCQSPAFGSVFPKPLICQAGTCTYEY